MTYSHEQLKAMCPAHISECSQKHVQSVIAELIETAMAQPASVKERWNIERDGDALLVCFNSHEKGEACRYERFVPEAQPVRVLTAARSALKARDDYGWSTEADEALNGLRAVLDQDPQPAQAVPDADAERFRWLIDDRNWNENEDTPSICTSEDVHWGDKARSLIDRHMKKD